MSPPANDNGYLAVPTAPSESNQDVVHAPEPVETTVLYENPEKKLDDASSDDTESDDDVVVVPPDGGWGWVVVAASFACNVIVDGIISTFGMFLTDIARTFSVTDTSVSLVGSLMSGFYLIAGPFASALANRYGFRLVAIVGSIIGALALVLSYFSTSLHFLCISYGILGGIGFGLIYVPAVITVGFYFERWRALATGIAVCGSGIGTFAFAPFSALLVESYGWRYALLTQAGLVLTCAIFGLLFRPLKPTKLKDLKAEKPELVMDVDKLPTETRLKMERALENLKATSITSVHDNHSTIPRFLGVNNNADYPTAADVWSHKPSAVYHTVHVPHHNRVAEIYRQEKRPSIPFIRVEDKSNGTAPLINENGLAPVIINTRRHTFSERRQRTTSESGQPRSRKETINHTDINRPLYRDDIFFGASLAKLPQYTSQASMAYNLAVTRMPTKNDVEEEKEHRCKLCPEAVRRTLATMLDISLLKSPSFLVLAISGAMTMMGFYVPFMYITVRATDSGMLVDTAKWLVSAIGIANTIGRVLSGLVSSLPSVNTLLINNVALTVGGIATILSGLSQSDEYQFFYAAVFGLAISCFASLRSVLVVELLGLEKLTNAFGLLLLFQGLAACVGAPLAGEFKNLAGSYDASFYLSGSLILWSAIICYPLNMINRWEKRKAKAVCV